MIDRFHHSIRRGAPLALAALLALAGCASDSEEQGQADAVAVDDDGTTDEATDDGSTDDTMDEDEGAAEGDDAMDESDDDGAMEDGEDSEDPYDGEDPYDTGDITSNECPAGDCLVQIIGAEDNGDGIEIKLDANYLADVGANHFHVYWDNWDASEVGTQNPVGPWVATADYPSYHLSADDATAVDGSARGDSTTICVTAADGDHAVLNDEYSDCEDLSSLIG